MGTASYRWGPSRATRRYDARMDDERRRLTAIVILFTIGFALVFLASAVSSTWPLFITPIPYAVIAWIVVQAADRAEPAPVTPAATNRPEREEGLAVRRDPLDRRGDRI
jgi:hypothetical protein